MRIFTTIDDVILHAEQNARSSRAAQRKHQEALDLLNAGVTPSRVAQAVGFRPMGKNDERAMIQRHGGAASAYEDMAAALTEHVTNGQPKRNVDPFDGFPTKVQER